MEQQRAEEYWSSPESKMTIMFDGELIEFDLNEHEVQKKIIKDSQDREYSFELENRVINIIAGPGGRRCARCSGSGREPS